MGPWQGVPGVEVDQIGGGEAVVVRFALSG
jgi:hypothetical protein